MSLLMVIMMMLMMLMTYAAIGDVNDDDAVEEGRYIYINAEAPFTIAALINMPLSLALPSLRTQRYRGRSYSKGVLTNDEDIEASSSLYEDPHYGPQSARLRTYFTYMQIEEEPCREKMLCQLAQDPSAYYPLSDIFLKQLNPRYGPVEEDESNRFWRYLSASKKGLVSKPGDCRKQYPKCSLDLKDVVNFSVLEVWQAVGRRLNINFVDY